MTFGCAALGLGVAMIVKVQLLAPVVLHSNRKNIVATGKPSWIGSGNDSTPAGKSRFIIAFFYKPQVWGNHLWIRTRCFSPTTHSTLLAVIAVLHLAEGVIDNIESSKAANSNRLVFLALDITARQKSALTLYHQESSNLVSISTN